MKYNIRVVNKGWFKKGHGFWTGKKRPDLINSGAAKTMFKKGHGAGEKHPELRGENSPVWKGDNASYSSLHKWVKRYLGSATHCSNNINHKSTQFGWGNISGEYKRELTDWHQLCNSCNQRDGIHIPERLKK